MENIVLLWGWAEFSWSILRTAVDHLGFANTRGRATILHTFVFFVRQKSKKSAEIFEKCSRGLDPLCTSNAPARCAVPKKYGFWTAQHGDWEFGNDHF